MVCDIRAWLVEIPWGTVSQAPKNNRASKSCRDNKRVTRLIVQVHIFYRSFALGANNEMLNNCRLRRPARYLSRAVMIELEVYARGLR